MTSLSASDYAAMARALQLARQGLNTTSPNPRVGCVIVRDGRIVGEGWHARAGEPHAEVHALAAAGPLALDATVYVTLEPCAHFGRTPPCADALVAAGVGRVVAAMEDPNPLVAGQGLARLNAAGIDTAVGVLEAEARELNLGFVSRMSCGRPWVRLKAAASLDGVTALANGASQWITGAPARRDGHAWRARACAVLTGIGTVRDDDPRLTVREVPCERQPLRVVVDSRLETPPAARVLAGAREGMPVLVVGAVEDAARRAALEAAGAEVLLMPNAAGKVELAALLSELARRGVNELHVEAGFKLSGSLVREGCVDELLLYFAPTLLGPGQGLFNLPALTDLGGRRDLVVTDLTKVGEDLRIVARFR